MDKKNKIIEYPVRINRYLYLMDISSRRQADKFIESGSVTINGKKAVLGQRVYKGDSVLINSRVKKFIKNYAYYVVNKPVGTISYSVEEKDSSAVKLVNTKENLSVVGRLDKASHGLIMLTNDGRIVDKMLNPKYSHEKEYVVRLNKAIKKTFKKKMESGVNIEGYKTKKSKVKILDDKSFKIILTEGKKHQIRRMVSALGYNVVDLKRIRIMNIKLKNLRNGDFRKLNKEEIKELMGQLKISND